MQIRTKITRTLALSGFVPAGKLGHAYRSLLPVLALCLATPVWSQSTLGLKGPHWLSITSGVMPSATPTADTPASAHYRFVTIGVPGSPNAQTVGINNARLAAGFYQDASYNFHGFVWQAGTFQTKDYPGAVYTNLQGTNNQDVVIGYYGDGTAEHAVLYSVLGGTWTVLPDIPGYSDNEGYGINDAGVAVGNAYQGSTSVAWVWHPGTSAYSFFTEPDAAPYSTYPANINDEGQMVGYYVDAGGVTHGFLKQGKTYSTIDAPEATYTYPLGINKSGTIGGEWGDAAGAAQGFVLTSGGLFTTVDYPGPLITAIEGINDYGDICGTYVENPSGARRAYIALRR